MIKSVDGSGPGQDTSVEKEITVGHHLDTSQREPMSRKTDETTERRTVCSLEGHHLEANGARQADVGKACRGLRTTTGYYGCTTMMADVSLHLVYRVTYHHKFSYT